MKISRDLERKAERRNKAKVKFLIILRGQARDVWAAWDKILKKHGNITLGELARR